MVEIVQSKSNVYLSALAILNKSFDVWEDDSSTNIFRRRFKNKVLQYFSYLFDLKPQGWLTYNSETQVMTIYGAVNTFMAVATEIEKLGIKVIIMY